MCLFPSTKCRWSVSLCRSSRLDAYMDVVQARSILMLFVVFSGALSAPQTSNEWSEVSATSSVSWFNWPTPRPSTPPTAHPSQPPSPSTTPTAYPGFYQTPVTPGVYNDKNTSITQVAIAHSSWPIRCQQSRAARLD